MKGNTRWRLLKNLENWFSQLLRAKFKDNIEYWHLLHLGYDFKFDLRDLVRNTAASGQLT